ncbi:hypothetical protein LNV09_17490 [Paucibacter sp. B2R-40]|uniref:hypothetical protein n=1 Tax=Paucibacter sp. B2R-40 TaxID=2893554 RepID=UPI0021E4E276|nr:hypothetical protein [Paucibacter sp. B2R-40]MCV2355938.1 hypothetical protein [Paucibacter sp. B2R-40]
MSIPPDFQTLSPWFEDSAARLTPGDSVSARLSLSEAIGNDAALGRLRSTARSLAEGTDLSRLDEHQLIELLTPLLVDGWLHLDLRRPLAYQLVPVAAPVSTPAPAAPAPAGPRPAVAAAPPEPVDSTFGSSLDVAAMVAVLKAAAESGVPFCEECARAAAQRQVAEAAPA